MEGIKRGRGEGGGGGGGGGGEEKHEIPVPFPLPPNLLPHPMAATQATSTLEPRYNEVLRD